LGHIMLLILGSVYFLSRDEETSERILGFFFLFKKNRNSFQNYFEIYLFLCFFLCFSNKYIFIHFISIYFVNDTNQTHNLNNKIKRH
jgi:hypothetical protein